MFNSFNYGLTVEGIREYRTTQCVRENCRSLAMPPCLLLEEQEFLEHSLSWILGVFLQHIKGNEGAFFYNKVKLLV